MTVAGRLAELIEHAFREGLLNFAANVLIFSALASNLPSRSP